jgi:cell division protein FtsW (lipid II flippase)
MFFQKDIAADSDSSAESVIPRRERVLLVLAALFVILNRVNLTLVRGESWLNLWPILVWLVCSTVLHLILANTLPERDPFILPIIMLLAGWGLTLVARLAPAFAIRQTLWLIVSSVALLGISILPPNLRLLQRYRYSWLLVGILVLGSTLIFGVNPSGNEFAPRLWLGFGALYFQPSEILKLLLVVFLASYLADKREILVDTQILIYRWRLPALSYIAPMLLMWGFCMILLVWQRDLGAASLFFLVFLSLLYIATGEASTLIIGGVLLLAGAIIGYELYGLVKLRVISWWNPWKDPDNSSFQIVQALIAVSAGGIFGQGVGQGSPTYVPVIHSDFVFAAIAEEWGVLGTLGIILCFALLVTRAMQIAIQLHERPFRSLLAAGIGLLFATQSLLIMAGVLKLIPLTGVTLPFVSYGGSSLLSSFVMIGLLLRLSDPESRLPPRNWRRKAQRIREFAP